MAEPADILISVDGRHLSNILEGKKTVELRRRPIKIQRGGRIWIYSKVPRGHVEALAIVRAVVADRPRRIWRCYGSKSAVSRSEFESYFRDLEVGYAIIFEEIRPLRAVLSLRNIRRRFSAFHPPQFVKRLALDSPELSFFQSALV